MNTINVIMIDCVHQCVKIRFRVYKKNFVGRIIFFHSHHVFEYHFIFSNCVKGLKFNFYRLEYLHFFHILLQRLLN